MFDELVSRMLPMRPTRVILFGSQAKGTAGEYSDIDFCVVAETASKRRYAAELQQLLDCEKPVDIIVYTPAEWEECLADPASFAAKIMKEGVVLYG